MNLAAKLSKVAHFDCDISDKQHTELLEVVRSMSKNGSKAIEELCAEGDRLLGVDNNSLREVWHQDVVERLECEKDQRKSGMLVITYIMEYMYIHIDIYFMQSQPVEETNGVR